MLFDVGDIVWRKESNVELDTACGGQLAWLVHYPKMPYNQFSKALTLVTVLPVYPNITYPDGITLSQLGTRLGGEWRTGCLVFGLGPGHYGREQNCECRKRARVRQRLVLVV